MTIENPGIKIRVLREIKGYTQENMAVELGISGKAYQKIESGETQLSIARLNQISEILELSVIDILSFDEEKIFKKNESKRKNVSSFINNSYSDSSSLISSKDELIETLKSEIEFLRKIVSKNLDL